MKLEKRTFDKGKTNYVIGICENAEESRIIDLLGDNFANRDSIPIKGEIRLSDGFHEHYILLKPHND